MFEKETMQRVNEMEKKLTVLEERLGVLNKSITALPEQIKTEIDLAVELGFAKALDKITQIEIQRKDELINHHNQYRFWFITTMFGTLMTTLLTVYIAK